MTPLKVSVIMPVYNGEKFLRSAIDSILSQTFSDFELIIINDGSSDSSPEIIASYDDPRIVFINNHTNTGLPAVRNQGLNASLGEYIAWLDCDDTSVPDRLEKQIGLFDKNPQIGVCGGWIRMVGAIDDRVVQFPIAPEFIRAEMLFNNCVATSTVMMRAACTREIGVRFDLSHHFSQDYGLWTRIARHWKITNLPEVLTIYRLHANQVTTIYKQKQMEIAWNIQREQLSSLGIFPTEKESIIHMKLGGGTQNPFEDADWVFDVRDYINKLYEANKKKRIYDEKAFREVLLRKWQTSSGSIDSSVKLTLTSYWMRFKLGGINFGLLWRAIRKIARMVVKGLR